MLWLGHQEEYWTTLNRRSINLNHVKILVLDEFDRMLDMGFSKDVDLIIRECPKRKTKQLML